MRLYQRLKVALVKNTELRLKHGKGLEALGVEHMLTKQENYRDPEVLAYARLAQRLALVPGTCEEDDE